MEIFFERGSIMRKNFLKIVSAATAIALALTIGVCSAAAEEDTKTSASSTADLTGENAKLIITSNEYAEKFEQIYEDELKKEVAKIEENFLQYEPQIMAGFSPYAEAKEKAEKIAQEECERLGLYAEAVLEPMDNVPFKGWKGSFPVKSVEDVTLTFVSPERFTCTAGNGTASITGKLGFYYIYKRASVTVTYNNGSTSSKTVEGTGKIVSADAPSKAGTITNGSYNLYMYNGTEPCSGYNEAAFITLYT